MCNSVSESKTGQLANYFLGGQLANRQIDLCNKSFIGCRYVNGAVNVC